MAKQGADALVVRKLVAEAREGGALSAGAAWARDGAGSINDLDAGTALAAIEAAVQLGNAAAIGRAAGEARDKVVRKAAGAAVHKLKSRGQSVEVQREGRVWSITDEATPDMPPFAMLGLPDPDGYFPFLMVATGGETIVFAGAAGGALGHREVDHTHLGRAQRRQVIADARRDPGLVELPFGTALHLVERAFTEVGEPPHEWDHLLHQLDPATLGAARQADPFAQDNVLVEDVLAQALPLIEGPGAIMLMPAAEVVQSLSEQLGALSANESLDEHARETAFAEAIEAAADEALSPVARRSWATAMDVAAVVAGARGWDDVRGPARQTALALRADWPGRRIPYIVANIERMGRILASRFSGPDLDDDEGAEADQ